MHAGCHVADCEQALTVALCHLQQRKHRGGSWETRLARRRCVNAMGRRHDVTRSTTLTSRIDTKTMIDHLAKKVVTKIMSETCCYVDYLENNK